MSAIRIFSNKSGSNVVVEEMQSAYQDVFSESTLTAKELAYINNLGTEKRRRELFYARKLVRECIGNYELDYDEQKKPCLLGSKIKISISHSNDYIVLAWSPNKHIGVDIEGISQKAERVRHKFLSAEELRNLRLECAEDYVLLWTVKESVFKKYSHIKHLIFSDDILIDQVDDETEMVKCKVKIEEGQLEKVNVRFKKMENYILSFTL